MTTFTRTINETIEELHAALREYIEAAYHVSDPAMLKQRRELLDELGVIHQRPFLESTPRYIIDRRFEVIRCSFGHESDDSVSDERSCKRSTGTAQTAIRGPTR